MPERAMSAAMSPAAVRRPDLDAPPVFRGLVPLDATGEEINWALPSREV